MKLDLVVPTLDREKKLINCIESILRFKSNYNITLYLYFSSYKEMEKIKKYYSFDWINYKFTIYDRCSSFWNQHLLQMKSDAMCYLNDDVILLENTLEKIFEVFSKQFPDYDGVMGLNQTNLPQDQIVKSAFGVIGNKYADRFPKRQVFCPDYYRFYTDLELYLYSNKINKFYFDEQIGLVHHHPSHGYIADETHRTVRKYRPKDSQIFGIRNNRKLLWGESFELIGDKI